MYLDGQPMLILDKRRSSCNFSITWEEIESKVGTGAYISYLVSITAVTYCTNEEYPHINFKSEYVVEQLKTENFYYYKLIIYKSPKEKGNFDVAQLLEKEVEALKIRVQEESKKLERKRKIKKQHVNYVNIYLD